MKSPEFSPSALEGLHYHLNSIPDNMLIMVENFCRKMNFTFFADSSVETQGFNWTYLLMHI